MNWRVNKINKLAIKAISKRIGHNKTTWARQLDQVGSELFGNKWSGVATSDDYLVDQEKPYAVVNVDKLGQSGSHWLAVIWELTGEIIYDSYGRKLKLCGGLGGRSNGRKKIWPDQDVEQTLQQTNCGQRSLSFIFIYDQYGKKMAMAL